MPITEKAVMTDENTTHFGYETVDKGDKETRVRQVFDSVATRYDLMNDLMSFGIHRLWKRFAIELAGIRRGQQILDLASGTGDLASRAILRSRFRALQPQGLSVGPNARCSMRNVCFGRTAKSAWCTAPSTPRVNSVRNGQSSFEISTTTDSSRLDRRR